MRTITPADGGTLFVQVVDDSGVAPDVHDNPLDVVVQFRIPGGHVPPRVRAALVDAVLDLPEIRRHNGLQATVPLGDAELIDQFRRRCGVVSTRAAGSTCLIDAELRACD